MTDLTAKSPIATLKLDKRITDELARWSITTIADLTRRSRRDIDLLGGIKPGDTEVIEAKLAKHGLEFTPSGGHSKVCTSCPACPDCGQPRATTARQVVTDGITGLARHGGFRAAPSTCKPCDEFHRDLVATRAVELAAA